MKPQRTQSKIYNVITACIEKFFISAFIPLCSLWLILSALSGCASTKEAKVAPEAGTQAGALNAPGTPAPEANKNEMPQPKNEISLANRMQELALPDFVKPAQPKILPLKIEKEPVDPKRITHFEGNVVLNAESMPLSDFIIYA